MALIKCPECGGVTSDTSSACPRCGASFSNLKRCRSCNHVITDEQSCCPHCGTPTPWHSTIMSQIHNTETKPKKNQLTVIIGLLLLLVVAAIGAMFGTKAYNDHQAKKAWEKHVADSIQTAQERLAAEEAEQERLEQEKREREFQEYMEKERLERERKQAEEDAKGPEWINGLWQWEGHYNGYHLETALYIYREERKYVMQDGSGHTERGSYEYRPSSNAIYCKAYGTNYGTTSYEVDTYNERLGLGQGIYLRHTHQGY